MVVTEVLQVSVGGIGSETEAANLSLDLLQGRQQFFVVRRFIEAVNLGKNNDSLLVDDEHGPLANPWQRRRLAHDAVRSRHRPVRIKIRAHGESDRTQFVLLPRLVAVHGIYADVQDLGIEAGKLL